MATQDIKESIQNDPFIYNLFTSKKYSYDNSRPMNWISIPTSFTTEGGKDTSIAFLSVYNYTAEESMKINASLKIAQGKDIAFSDEGHVALGYANNTASTFIPNPIATKNVKGVSKPISAADTIYNRVINNWQMTFYYDENILFSPNLKWILYKLPGKSYVKTGSIWSFTDGAPTGNMDAPVYVLLYNTMHRKNFQSVYSRILNQTRQAFSTQSYLGPNTSYITTATKYCNAFRIGKFTSRFTGNTIYHYGDPSCTLIMNDQLAQFSLILAANVTQKSLKNDYYPRGIKGFNDVAQSFSNALGIDDPYCGRGSGNSPSLYVRNVANLVIPTNSTSFLRQLTNFQIFMHGTGNIQLPSDWANNAPGLSNNAVACPVRNLEINQCSTIVNAAGQIDIKGTTIQNQCGGAPGRSADTSKTDTGGSGTQDDSGPPDIDPSSGTRGSGSSSQGSSPLDPSSGGGITPEIPDDPNLPDIPDQNTPHPSQEPDVPSGDSLIPGLEDEYLYMILGGVIFLVILFFFFNRKK